MKRLTTILTFIILTSMLLVACQPAPAAEEEGPGIADVKAPEDVTMPEYEAPEGEEEEAPAAPALELSSVNIGVLLPLTGALAEFGSNFRSSADLAKMNLDAAGFPTELEVGDTETNPVAGTESARTLVDVQGVPVLIGGAASSTTISVAETVAIPNEVLQISYASSSPLISGLPADEGKDFLYRTVASDGMQGVVLAIMAMEEGYESVSVLFVNNSYGQGLSLQFKYSFEKRGGTVPKMVPHDEAPAPTYVAELRQIMEDTPDAIVALSYPGHATVYLKEFFEGGYSETTDLIFVDGTKSLDLPEEVGADLLAGFKGTAAVASEEASPDAFKTEFEAEFGELPPLPYMDTTYDAIIVARLAAGLAEANGMEVTGASIRDYLRDVANEPGEKIGPGLEDLKKAFELIAAGEDIDYEGAVGVFFDEYGDILSPIEVWQYTAADPFIETVDVYEVGSFPLEPIPEGFE